LTEIFKDLEASVSDQDDREGSIEE
jgi:hypothetical protein